MNIVTNATFGNYYCFFRPIPNSVYNGPLVALGAPSFVKKLRRAVSYRFYGSKKIGRIVRRLPIENTRNGNSDGTLIKHVRAGSSTSVAKRNDGWW